MAKEALAFPLVLAASQLRTPEEKSRFDALPLPGLQNLFGQGLFAGTVTQIEGLRSSGRTALAAYVLAQATRRGRICAVVDGASHFFPEAMERAGVALDHLVWVRCNGQVEHALRATDLLLHAGGFGVLWLDLCELPKQVIQRIPLATWHRFRRAVENTSTSLLISGEVVPAKSPTTNQLRLKRNTVDWLGNPGILQGLQMQARSEKSSGPVHSVLRAVV